jgi:hypothetical protein
MLPCAAGIATINLTATGCRIELLALLKPRNRFWEKEYSPLHKNHEQESFDNMPHLT